ncbi:MAG: hypothetical protein HDR05_01940 [Lachnospiraceae bacterium]|nr:hypothetical protein [Lachnospiraceae bacterium]
MIFSTGKDYRRCTEIVRKELAKRNVKVKGVTLRKITKDVMNISYAKGGDYSNEIIFEFARAYVEHGLYKKFLR